MQEAYSLGWQEACRGAPRESETRWLFPGIFFKVSFPGAGCGWVPPLWGVGLSVYPPESGFSTIFGAVRVPKTERVVDRVLV